MLTLTIARDGDALMEVGRGENVLVPLDPEERAQVFVALVEAVSLLAGVPGPGWPAPVSGEPVEAGPVPAGAVVSLDERRPKPG